MQHKSPHGFFELHKMIFFSILTTFSENAIAKVYIDFPIGKLKRWASHRYQISLIRELFSAAYFQLKRSDIPYYLVMTFTTTI